VIITGARSMMVLRTSRSDFSARSAAARFSSESRRSIRKPSCRAMVTAS
jgi:hypothetical protein